MTAAASRTLATLGGPGTFAHQASMRILELHPELGGSLDYVASMEDMWSALDHGRVGAVIMSEQTSRLGWDEADQHVAPLGSGYFVHASVVVPYHCLLLVKPGTELSDIDGVYGHGSIRMCRAWLDEHLPGVPSVIHSRNSVAAAHDVAAGDGTKAVVGTMITAELTGLTAIAEDIDLGSTAAWWVISREPCFSDDPDELVVSARLPGDGQLWDLVASLREVGFRLRTSYSQASGRALYEYDYLLGFIGRGRLGAVEQQLARSPTARLVGAYRAAASADGRAHRAISTQ